MLKTRLTELLGVDHPIISGGMMRVSTAELVSAVANGGAFGFLTAFAYFDTIFASLNAHRTDTDIRCSTTIWLIKTFQTIVNIAITIIIFAIAYLVGWSRSPGANPIAIDTFFKARGAKNTGPNGNRRKQYSDKPMNMKQGHDIQAAIILT